MKEAFLARCSCSADWSGGGLVLRQAQPIFAVAEPSCSEGPVVSRSYFPDASCEVACGELTRTAAESPPFPSRGPFTAWLTFRRTRPVIIGSGERLSDTNVFAFPLSQIRHRRLAHPCQELRVSSCSGHTSGSDAGLAHGAGIVVSLFAGRPKNFLSLNASPRLSI
jgi:hypothetical protein